MKELKDLVANNPQVTASMIVNFRNKFSLENQYQEKGAQSIEKWAFLGKNTCKIQREMVN